MPPGSTRWISGSTVFRNKPVAAQRSVARKTWSRKWIPTYRLQPAERSRLSGPQRRIQSSLKSNDYVNVFTGQHTRSHLINARTSWKRKHLRSETVETQPNHHFPPVAPAQVLWFFCDRAIYEISSSYLGLNPAEHSSGGKQRLGHISKQGNRMMRWLLVEAAY